MVRDSAESMVAPEFEATRLTFFFLRDFFSSFY